MHSQQKIFQLICLHQLSQAEISGSTFTPNYRTGDFLDPKARAKNTGVEYAQGLVALGGDDEELAKENIKVDVNGTGVVLFQSTM